MLFKVLILVTFVTSPAITRVTNNGSSSCSLTSYGDLDEFRCDGGRTCIELNQICDGIQQCLDGRDELFCSSPGGRSDLEETSAVLHRRKRQIAKCSKYSQWQCRDGSCISVDGKCDGAVDCPDGSDETFPLCRKMPCQRNLFRCTYGACVDGNAPCNGSPECADKSDELLPKCRNETSEVRGKFRCQDGTWISASDHCDGVPNCPDGSDETVAACADKSCPGYLFQCAYGACVDRGSGCNGKQDCADGSDESDELCNRQGSGTTATPPKSGKCVVPPYPEHGTFVVSNVPNARPGQSFESFVLEVRCNQDYGIQELYGKGGDGSQQVFCIDGNMIQQMPKCTRFCKLNPDPSVRYTCQIPGTTAFNDCETYVPPDIAVQPVCNNNYYYNGVLKRMRCVAGVGSFDSLAQCKPDCGQVNPEGTPLIIDGKSAKRGELPWHVGIYRKTTNPYEQICGGSLVSNTVVISAAHCFWDGSTSKQHPTENYAVAIGKLYRPWNNPRDEDAQKSDLTEIRIPKLFLGADNNFQEDIAILVLTTAFVYKTYVRPVCLHFDPTFERQQLQPNHLGKVAGWGLTAANGNASQVLKVVELPFIDDNTCIDTMPASFRQYLTGDKFCAGYTNGTALCRGDSGGGLAFPDNGQGAQRYYLRGIVSTAPSEGDLCNAHTFTAFTKISRHEQLITEYL